MSTTQAVIRRALLYGMLSCTSITPKSLTIRKVPGSSQKMLEKSRGLNVDCVAYDLEDSVTPGKKAEARSRIRRLLNEPRPAGVKENAVRINALETGLALEDLTEVVRSSDVFQFAVIY